MTIEVFAILLVLATAGTLVSLSNRARETHVGLIVAAATAVMWGVLVVSAGAVTHYSGGETVTHSYQTIQWLAVGGLGIAVLAVIQATFQDMTQLEKRL